MTSCRPHHTALARIRPDLWYYRMVTPALGPFLSGNTGSRKLRTQHEQETPQDGDEVRGLRCGPPLCNTGMPEIVAYSTTSFRCFDVVDGVP